MEKRLRSPTGVSAVGASRLGPPWLCTMSTRFHFGGMAMSRYEPLASRADQHLVPTGASTFGQSMDAGASGRAVAAGRSELAAPEAGAAAAAARTMPAVANKHAKNRPGSRPGGSQASIEGDIDLR